MDNEKTQQGKKEPDNKGIVIITIDTVEHKIRAGEHKVTELKKLGNVPPDYVLAQIIDGRVKDLNDDQTVKIRGREVFSSHPRSGGSA